MNRDKLAQLIDSFLIKNEDGYYCEQFADYLIANGIGDITSEKHRADVAEMALKLGIFDCKFNEHCPQALFGNTEYCRCGYGDETEECDTSKSYLCWAEYFKQQAEERLKEKKDDKEPQTA